MRGRRLYQFGRPVLLGASNSLRLLPRSFCVFLFVLARNFPTRLGVALRYVLLRRLVKECGDVVAVFEGAHLLNLSRCEIGNNVSIHEMCYLDAAGGLRIGSDVSIAHGATIVTANHDFSVPTTTIRDAPVVFKPVTVGDDCWIGAGARIMAGVTLGTRVVVGAGAVVTKDLPSGSLAIGVPARVVKTIAAPSNDAATRLLPQRDERPAGPVAAGRLTSGG